MLCKLHKITPMSDAKEIGHYYRLGFSEICAVFTIVGTNQYLWHSLIWKLSPTSKRETRKPSCACTQMIVINTNECSSANQVCSTQRICTYVDRFTLNWLWELVVANSYALWDLTWTFGCYYLWINCDLCFVTKGFVDNIAWHGRRNIFCTYLNAVIYVCSPA